MAKKTQEELDKELQETSKEETKVKEEKKKEPTKDEIITQLRDELLRAQADFDNLRKRSAKELIEARERGIITLATDLLPAIDNFELSLQMSDNKEMFIKGVEMIHNNLLETLKEHKIEHFTPKIGEQFDPYKHEPVPIEKEDAQEGTILGILKKGYQNKDSIVRPARVQVKKIE